ncbi:MAG: hypothetical protein Q7R39_15655, partial [Dehalococcoidia bacterium]|nr:hypothetical protein [Dehalococcoidia bacterium]
CAPCCSKRHMDGNEAIPLDWPHTLAALYRVRCNLFHGEKALDSENDGQVVAAALRALLGFMPKAEPMFGAKGGA